MKCSKCGVEVNSESGVCPACGAGIKEARPTIRIGRWRISRMAATSCLVLALLLFLMPWINLECAGTTVETVSGADLLIGVEYASSSSSYNSNPYSSYYGQTETYREGPEILVVLAFAAGVIGVALFLVNTRLGTLGRGAMGILGMVFLLGLVIKVNHDIGDTDGMVAAEYLGGFYLTFLCFLGAAVASFLPFWNAIFESPGPAAHRTGPVGGRPVTPPPESVMPADAGERAGQDSAGTARAD